MILDYAHRRSFIHIPKCGGSAIREHLKVFDTTSGAFFPRIAEVDGRILDLTHLPLVTLREVFPGHFDFVAASDSYCIVRDPHDRFLSSVSQRLKMYEKKHSFEVSKAELFRYTYKIISALEQANDLLPFDFIHFQRQQDYIFVDGELVVSNIFPLARQADILEHWGGGETPKSVRKNPTFLVSNSIGRSASQALVKLEKSLGGQIVTGSVRAKLKSLLQRGQEDIKTEFKREFRSFIDTYYADDIEFYRELDK